MKDVKNKILNGQFKDLYDEYKKDEELKSKVNEFKAGYYTYRRNDCGECLQCLGGLVCADTLCECMGGDICSFF
ncbi:hypothetical protein OF820_00880 [Oceanotoga sp. DSM 15011]|uniref:Uncharacterized protein n=1 Tax=Oceanotoga teriensis TaxID=515440 RepID=A0AA45C979_9BACT|nr:MULTISPECIES: hypothetical protein [Oceanotoga]MDN5341644.1 hypothetical protein [Oceanotoga sp.]MDO7977154.1 hypothetical protein [Oceanotoga teriensis]PWJ96575.1 hypothetical protein C7380_101148 [Oceanotoga teriensis]UYP00251.1 hypothetical protein OF820_00880 [Oceanotoga sp. DSM 15011]